MILDSGKPYYFSARCFNYVVFPNQQNQLTQCSVVPVSHSIAFHKCFQMMPQHFGSRVVMQHINKCLSRNFMAKSHLLGLVFKTLAAFFLPLSASQSGKQQFEVFRHFRFVFQIDRRFEKSLKCKQYLFLEWTSAHYNCSLSVL